jgi:hypothetical protein
MSVSGAITMSWKGDLPVLRVTGDRESGTPWNSRHGIRPSDPGQEYPEDTEGTSYTGFDARAVPGDS